MADCMPKSTLASDRTDMANGGIAPVPVEILDYWGTYTGKPRPTKVSASVSGTKRQFAQCKATSGVGGKADLPVERPDFSV